jgi:hypothetical protein
MNMSRVQDTKGSPNIVTRRFCFRARKFAKTTSENQSPGKAEIVVLHHDKVIQKMVSNLAELPDMYSSAWLWEKSAWESPIWSAVSPCVCFRHPRAQSVFICSPFSTTTNITSCLESIGHLER